MVDASIILNHTLVPKHEVLSKEEAETLLSGKEYSKDQLPKINLDDAAVEAIGAAKGDVLKITRQSITAGETVYYRLVS